MSKPVSIKVNEKALRLAVFSFLMQTGSGIAGKTSGYILDKFDKVLASPIDLVADLLDPVNKEKLKKWLEQEG